MFNSTKKAAIFDSGNNNSLFGKGTSIKGNISGEGDIRIDGILHGNINISGKLIVGESAVILGDIKAERAEIYGQTTGTINVVGLLSIKNPGIVEGDLYVGQLQIEKSAIFKGVSHMELPGQVVGIKNDHKDKISNPTAVSIAQ